MINSIIIDDNEDFKEVLCNYIKINFSNICILDKVGTVEDGIKSIKLNKPELVFLDIILPDGDGFDILNQTNKIDFEVIFITSYDKYAIKAFKFCALDYIIKPVQLPELIAAVRKAEERINTNQFSEVNIKLFYEKLKSSLNSKNHKIALFTKNGIYFKPVHEIVRFEASGSYTWCFLNNKEKMLLCKNLSEYEELLSNYNFFRIHKTHLVNMDYVEKYAKQHGGYVEMKNGAKLEISRRKKDSFLSIMGVFHKLNPKSSIEIH